MQVTQLADGVFIIDNVFSEDECKRLISFSESLGYKSADVDIHGQRKMLTMIRTNERVDMESEKLAKELWDKLPHDKLPKIDDQLPVNLTPFFRFYRYEGKQKFNMHKDGSKLYEGRQTRLTLLVFLNSLEKCGATRFRDAKLDVFPQAGRVLLFRHELWHAGMPASDGVKYVLRTDVAFE